MKKKLHKLLLFLLLCQLHVFAQTEGYNYQATIKPVDSSGFYNIVLGPVLNAYLKTDYSDFRVVDSSNKWIPHLVREINAEISKGTILSEQKIVKKENKKDATTLIIESTDKTISNIILTVRNTTARRYCSISGSDENGIWYQISDSVEIVLSKADEINSKAILLFPSVNYKYIMLYIDNIGKEPLNIIKTETEKPNLLTDRFYYSEPTENPDTKLIQNDSNKVSFIKIEQSQQFQFEWISLLVKHQGYFKRKAELYIPSTKNHSYSNPGLLSATFTISNNSTSEYKVPPANAKVFYILIYNNDNPPLSIYRVKTLCNYRVATVYLEKFKPYKLLLDNKSASLPKYDLSLGDIPYKKIIRGVEVGKISSIQKPATVTHPEPNSKKIIWLVIVVAAVVLAFFTYRLATDMNKSKS